MFLDIPLSVGDAFSGSFSNNPGDGFVLSDNGTTVDYRSSISNAMFSSGLYQLPRPELELAFWDLGNSIAVSNDGPVGDRISFLQRYYSEEWRGLFSIILVDSSGEVFSDTDLPSTFNLDDFSLISFRLNLQHTGGNGVSVSLYSTLSTVNATPVPVPAAGLLLVSACTGLLLGKARTRV